MAHYLVNAKPKQNQLAKLKERLDSGEIHSMRPFGPALDHSLKHARLDPEGWIIWEEKDYCRPPLAMERAAVLDTYFTDLSVKEVQPGTGWHQIELLPSLWPKNLSNH
jgi:hypothetical protein